MQLLDRLGPDEVPDGGDTRRRALTNLAIALQATSPGSEELQEVVGAARASGGGYGNLRRMMVLDVIDVSNRQALGDFTGATAVAHEGLAAAEAAGDEMWTAFARQFLGATLVWRGELTAGMQELEQAGAYWEQGDPGLVGARPVGALWTLLGLAACLADRPADATGLLARAREAIPAEDSYGRCLVATTAAIADQLADRPAVVRRAVEPVWSLAMDLASEFWLGWAQMLLGWSIAADGGPTGLAMMAEALDGTETRQAVPYFAYLLGSRLCEQGQAEAGLGRLDDGLATAAATGEALWVPVLHFERARWLDVAGARAAADEAAVAAVDAAQTTGAALVSRRVTEWRAARTVR